MRLSLLTRALCLGVLLLSAGRAPAAVKGTEHPFDYFANSWSVIGLKDYPRGTRVSPDQALFLDGEVRARVLLGGEPIPRSVTKTLLNGYLPVVEWKVEDDRARLAVQAFAAPLPGPDEAARWSWPAGDGNYVNVLRLLGAGGRGAPLPAGLELFGKGAPHAGAAPAPALRWERLPSGVLRGTAEGKTWVLASPGTGPLPADPAGTLPVQVPRDPKAPVVFWIPFAPLAEDAALVKRAEEDPHGAQALAAAVAFWEGLLARGAELSVPEPKVMETYRASLAYQFIGRDLGEVHAGEGFYDGLYLRDGAYQIQSLELAGYLDEARQSLEFYLRHQTPEGQFVTQAGQYDAHGYALWAFDEYYLLTRDRAFLEKVYPQVAKAVAWIEKARARTAGDPRWAGLLPAAPADGENLWDGKHHIVGYDFWCLRGLLCAAEMARALGRADDAGKWSAAAEEYRAAILRALDAAGTPYFPPSFEGAGTHWGDLECLYPTPLFPPDDKGVAATLQEVRERFGGGFVEGTIRWSPGGTPAIHPYLSQFVTNDELVCGRRRAAIEGFYSFLLHTTATHGFPEGVYYRKRTAWSDTVPHLWAAGLYTLTLRNMLLREYGDELHLSSAIPAQWVRPGAEVRLARAPTHFGLAGATWRGEAGGMLVRLSPPERRPARVVIHLPDGYLPASATCDAGKPELSGDAVVVSPQARRVRIRFRKQGTAAPIDFARVVAAYQRSAAAPPKPLPGLVKLPLVRPLKEEECVLLDLSAAATTDPFHAPFLVPTTGPFLFTGLKTGVQTAGGVPFRILDPAANGGKGLVVLRGANVCETLPESVAIPVHRKAGRLFLLGCVTGWQSDDPGAGEWGAVATITIRYADGSTQVVPLVSGRTADDWVQPPAATDVMPALTGTPWHLNLLGVELRPKETAEIEFRDLGTPAAPVLAAATLAVGK